MMDTLSTLLWLCFTFQIITAEPQSESKKVQNLVFGKCHHFMSQAERTDCLFEHVTYHVSDVDDKLNAVVENVTENENHLNDFKLEFNSRIDDIHRDVSGVKGRIDDINNDISSKHDRHKIDVKKILDDVNSKVTKLHEGVAEARGKIEELKSDSTSFVRSRNTSLNELNSSISDKISILNKTVDNMIGEVKNDMNKEVEELNKQVHDLSESTNSQMKQIDNKFLETHSSISTVEQRATQLERADVTLQSSISSLQGSVMEVKAEMEDAIDSQYKELMRQMNDQDLVLNNSIDSSDKDKTAQLEAHAKQINELFKKLSSDVSKVELKFDDEIKTIKDEFDGKYSETEGRVKEVQKHMKLEVNRLEAAIDRLTLDIVNHKNTVKNDMDEAIQQLKQQMTSDFNQQLKKLESDMATMRNEIIEEIRNQEQNLLTKTREVNQTVTQQQSTLNIVYANAFDKGMLILAILLLFVFIGINYFIVYIIVKRTKPAQVSSSSVLSRSMTMRASRSSPEVRNLFGTYEPLMNTVCVISFAEQSQKHNKKLIKSLHEQLPVAYHDKVTYHVIRRHEDIPDTPLAKLCFMFVEFTERHVIIEEPGLGLGDLKRKTFTYVTDSNVCLVIIYVKDPASRRLSNEDLYNNDIHCVSLQEELISLRDQDRFISIYDNFNKRQFECLLKLIKDNIK